MRPRQTSSRPKPPDRRRRHTPAAAVEPERLQKVLARSGVGSRRDMDAWIAGGRVQVNDRPAELGQRVGPGDRVKVDGRLVNLRFEDRLPRVLLYHKPAGEIVSADDPEGRTSVFEKLPRLRGARWVSVGRLDYNTEGLLVLTTSGDLAAHLMHPRHGFEREYAIRVQGELTPDAMRQLVTGVELEDGPARFDSLVEAGGEGRNRWYKAILREGRYREVRRMLEAVGCTVSRLLRTRYGPIAMPRTLKRGMSREMEPAEVEALFGTLGIQAPGAAARGGAGSAARGSPAAGRRGVARRR
jgi:23S rRNA pseudouridine2605 synthase